MKNLLRSLLFLSFLVFAGSAFAQTSPTEGDRPPQFLSKPAGKYPERARLKDVEGTVLLKVTLLSTGEVGEIRDVTVKDRKKLTKYGLVGGAMEAAKLIKFIPKIVDGKPVTTVVTIGYSFSVY